MTLDFKDVSEQPELRKRVLLKYKKGTLGPFLIEGYLTDVAHDLGKKDDIDSGRHNTEFWRGCGYGLCYFDFSDRQLQSLTAKKSKNQVLEWALLP
jgi:hypothetical protein